MLELLQENLKKTYAIRRKAIELQDQIFEKEGFTIINGHPYWVHDKKAYYIFMLINITGRFIQNPHILKEITEAVVRIVDFSNVDKILTLEAMGLHVGTALSLKTNKPLTIAGKVKYRDEITNWEPPYQMFIEKKTGYSASRLYINDIIPHERILLIDSIISTGGSFVATIKKLQEYSVEIVDAIAVIEKADYDGVERVKRETGVDVKTLVKVNIRDVVERDNTLLTYNDVEINPDVLQQISA